MASSAGRARNNPTRPQATRRFTLDERAEYTGRPEDQALEVLDPSAPEFSFFRASCWSLIWFLLCGATSILAGSLNVYFLWPFAVLTVFTYEARFETSRQRKSTT